MHKYEVTARFLELKTGVVSLEKAQAADRAHALKHIKGTHYELLTPTQFKRGEVFGYEGKLPAAIAAEVVSQKAKGGEKAKGEDKAKGGEKAKGKTSDASDDSGESKEAAGETNPSA